MLITDVTRTKRGRYGICLDGEFFCALHVDIFAAARLKTGDEVCERQMEELRRESELKITRERALKLLGQRAYTERGLYEKLLERTDERSAATAVARMLELGLLDDGDYARRYARECVERKGFSSHRTELELARKGIGRTLAAEVLAEIEADPFQAITQLLRKKYPRCLEDEKSRNRALNGLLRLGYPYGEIAAALREFAKDNEEEE